ncbi:aminoglycoside phosphotransferase family protein [Legionella shakespearei]|uniref:Aminoglycoside/hydroxyurea antibiotic resistance kinase n=1 Tax=Legionella shakespearei DSM 23087 TaxID=1122169 RepID=A0A0W0YM38_9GAMM|nr:aminoglycoside phosphotransferase family protein [Legionella shakespearei]KTD57651.1 Aminoglycoside/hydroxyurea antibiotic resistance kinase [Legionella shakespearei DSM 23087]
MKVLKKNVISQCGDEGKQWLDSLPELIKQMEMSYGLSGLKAVKNLSYNYVLSGFQESQPVILKLGPDIDGFKREALALKAFSGFGVVKVLAECGGMLLLERAVPGVSLKSYFPEQDNDAIHIACDCLKRLHQAPLPPIHAFPHIKERRILDWCFVQAVLSWTWALEDGCDEDYFKQLTQVFAWLHRG